MKMLSLFVAVSASCLALAACETTAQRIDHKENNLAAAGFTVLPANTPDREAELNQLPPNKFVPKPTGDQVQYVYADPVECKCLYVGDQKAYGAYRQEVLAKHLANEQQMTAQMYQDRWDWGRWDWGPWGGGWWR
jgi:hypothetical protein